MPTTPKRYKHRVGRLSEKRLEQIERDWEAIAEMATGEPGYARKLALSTVIEKSVQREHNIYTAEELQRAWGIEPIDIEPKEASRG